ncbi:retropepsin-like aspartic protease family protein [Prevotella pectinovora]|uniref:retropepsin-like aspartic protease family protein n=1 Tax=Prevotella pectinovora TaxID=1602169 RepID=UPI00069851F4|nr:retropepsin-like aspartic protease [Prevotella pectinovora]
MVKRVILFVFFILTSICVLSQTVIEMSKDGGVYKLPCSINGYEVDMIFDTGASNVSLSSKIATYLFQNGMLHEFDIIGEGASIIASGESIDHVLVNIKRLEIGGVKIEDVKAVILDSQTAPLLLGLSAIQKIGKVEIDGNKLIINKNTTDYSSEYVDEIYNNLKQLYSAGNYNIIIHQMEDFKYKNLLTDKGYWFLAECYLKTHRDKECIDICNEWILDPHIVMPEDSYLYSYYFRMIAYDGINDKNNTIYYAEKTIDYIERKKEKLQLSSDELNFLLGYSYYMCGNVYYNNDEYILAISKYDKSVLALSSKYGLSSIDILEGKGKIDDIIGSSFLHMALAYGKMGDNNGYIFFMVFSAISGNKVAIEACNVDDIDYFSRAKKMKKQIQNLNLN